MKPLKYFTYFALIFLFLFSTSFLCPEDVWEEDCKAYFTITPETGTTNTEFTFNAEGSKEDPEWEEAYYLWDNGAGTKSLGGKIKTYKYDEPGTYEVTLHLYGNRLGDPTDGDVFNRTLYVTPPAGDIPIASLTVNPQTGTVETIFTFDASGSTDNQTPSDKLQVRWDWTNDGIWDLEYLLFQIVQHQFTLPGNYETKVEVKDEDGNTDITSVSVEVEGETGNPCPGVPYVDYGGKRYNTVLIGNQCWFRENLDVGEQINASIYQINDGKIEKWCYDDLPANCETYGGLYQWDEMMQYTLTPGSQGICPDGWHIPVEEDFTQLSVTLGGPDVAGGKLKATTLWKAPNTGATNESGFTALPGGWCLSYGEGYKLFEQKTEAASFYGSWHSTITLNGAYGLYYLESGFWSDGLFYLSAKSVRCVKDE